MSAAERLAAAIFDMDGVLVDSEPHHHAAWRRLCLVPRLVRLHGGRVVAESRLGHGTTSRYSLPLDRPQGSRRSRDLDQIWRDAPRPSARRESVARAMTRSSSTGIA